MKLSKKLAEIFEEEFEKVFEKEKTDKDFLKQEDFSNCRERAQAGIEIAMENVISTLALTIALHREKEHGDNTIEEQASLLSAGADPEVSTRSWWNA